MAGGLKISLNTDMPAPNQALRGCSSACGASEVGGQALSLGLIDHCADRQDGCLTERSPSRSEPEGLVQIAVVGGMELAQVVKCG
jgi:hypothetical protein